MKLSLRTRLDQLSGRLRELDALLAAEDATRDLDRFRATGTTVLPISVDAVPSLKEFKAKERLSVELLSDFKRDVCRRYGTLLEDRFYSARAYVLIDAAGVVRWTFFEETPSTRRENDELLRQIQAL